MPLFWQAPLTDYCCSKERNCLAFCCERKSFCWMFWLIIIISLFYFLKGKKIRRLRQQWWLLSAPKALPQGVFFCSIPLPLACCRVNNKKHTSCSPLLTNLADDIRCGDPLCNGDEIVGEWFPTVRVAVCVPRDVVARDSQAVSCRRVVVTRLAVVVVRDIVVVSALKIVVLAVQE